MYVCVCVLARMRDGRTAGHFSKQFANFLKQFLWKLRPEYGVFRFIINVNGFKDSLSFEVRCILLGN